METLDGFSSLTEASAAVKEATASWGASIPDILFVFCSPRQDAAAIAAELARRYPRVPMVGCSTAGEHLRGQHYRGSLVIAGLCDTAIDWVVASRDGLGGFNDAVAEAFTEDLFAAHGVDRETLDSDEFVALLFVDGLSRSEEVVSASLAAGLGGIALAGGSAGDDLEFRRTTVICDGTARDDRMAVVLARSRGAKIRVLKHQHFTTTDTMLAVTRADPFARKVYEFDGYPAAEAYARALGIKTSELDSTASFLHPVTFRCDGELYVRSIQSINEDGSLTFYCAIEEGMVLALGDHHDMRDAMEEDLCALCGLAGRTKVDFILGFNCVLRALEATEGGRWDELGEALGDASRASIGFDTYGEQLNGLHINQTLVAVAFSSPLAEGRMSG